MFNYREVIIQRQTEKKHHTIILEKKKEIAVNEFIDDSFIDTVLTDNRSMSIKGTPEFDTNLSPDSYTNKFITSIFSKDRFIFFIRYGIVYVDSPRDGLHKHIIRYPQYFAIKELVRKMDDGLKKRCCLAYTGLRENGFILFYEQCVKRLLPRKKIVTKFYFVVDRLDLLTQASTEFSSRGMTIANINSKEDFKENIKSAVIVPPTSQEGRYVETMNVVNIQKFSDDSTVDLEIDKEIQHIYFLDEVHRGYKPKGTFLANLLGSDPNGIFIGLTGTPILKENFKTTDLFSDYIHKYYYNMSIADGYTLKIKKENIATHFKNDVRNLLNIEKGKRIPSKDWELVTKEPVFVEKLCQYVEKDFDIFRTEVYKDMSLGSMIVTSSSEQARAIQDWFRNHSSLKTALVLYDEKDNKGKQEEFRGKRNKEKDDVIESKYDGVVVYNMLLTGFDAPRLKRLYLLRQIKEHSLLQTLARVNRPYKNMKYGYVVDFVDITEEYEETNRRYLEELKDDIVVDDSNDVEEMFIDVEKIKEQIRVIENKLFSYMGNIEGNLEAFQIQIQPLCEQQLREIKSSLMQYRECYNELRMSHEDVSNIPIERINKAYYEVSNRIHLKVVDRIIDNPNSDVTDVDFTQLIVEFLKTGEMDLEFTTEDDILDRVNKIQNAFSANNDKKDDKLHDLQKRFKEIIRSFRDEASTSKEINGIIEQLDNLLQDILILNAQNNGLTSRYNGDDSCMRIHKKILKYYDKNLDDIMVYQIITEITQEVDKLIGHIHQPSEKVIFHQMKSPVKKAFKKQKVFIILKTSRRHHLSLYRR
ncbi:type I restriction enzyme subunit R domain-containing protein [Bacillus cereus]